MRIGLYAGNLHRQAPFRALRELGFTTVFGSSSSGKAGAIASNEGLEYFCVDWTFKLPRRSNRRMVLRDCSGEERRWAGGSSGCPSSPQLVKTASLKGRLGAFVFSPSLASFVGQDYETLGECLDLVSPMMYTSGGGAACLRNARIAAYLYSP
jgi:hypothetical protein